MNIQFNNITIKAENLIRLSDAMTMTGFSRQAIESWADPRGVGRGRNEPLVIHRLFGHVPVLDREYFLGWLERTENDANAQHRDRAASKARVASNAKRSKAGQAVGRNTKLANDYIASSNAGTEEASAEEPIQDAKAKELMELLKGDAGKAIQQVLNALKTD